MKNKKQIVPTSYQISEQERVAILNTLNQLPRQASNALANFFEGLPQREQAKIAEVKVNPEVKKNRSVNGIAKSFAQKSKKASSVSKTQ